MCREREEKEVVVFESVRVVDVGPGTLIPLSSLPFSSLDLYYLGF